jgi:exopolysaccharide biosynthesis predicted pyruvyltransferase EpsI
VDKISKILGLETFSILPRNRFEDVGSNGIESCKHPSISDWINSYVNAEFIITDSYHGVVLSIIFKKEFICIGNNNRGLTRMTNILKKYNLMDRLIFDNANPSDVMKLKKIDYFQIHTLLELERKKSLAFLKFFLEKSNLLPEIIRKS